MNGLAALARVGAWVTLAACGPSEPPPPPVDPSISFETFLEPPAELRPMARWWWPGGDVEEAELLRELDAMAADYFGGVEIQALSSGLDPDADAATLARRHSFDSPEYYERVRAVLRRAGELGVAVDLTVGSGWPLASHRYPLTESMQTLMHREWRVSGPARVELTPLTPARGGSYAFAEIAESTYEIARFVPDGAVLVGVVAAREIGGERDPVEHVLTDTLRLDPDSLEVIARSAPSDGPLIFDAPEGAWVVVAVFRAPDGEHSTDVAEPGEPPVLDHFDPALVERELEHLLGERTGLAAFRGGALRAAFTDSFEFKTDRHVTPDIVAEFERRRGYDIVPRLPVLLVPGANSIIPESIRLATRPELSLSDEDDRVRHDYARTISELFIERFLQTATRWTEARGLTFRAQPYGIDVDVLRAAGAVHVPEAEQLWAGGSEMLLRAVASGAWLYGRDVVSVEALVFGGRGFMTTPAKLRVGADKAFAAGVNQLVYHGVPYDHPGDYGVVGWMPFASRYPRRGSRGDTGAELMGERWAHAGDLQAINRYVARGQYLMRQGAPGIDVLVYYPWLGFPNSLGSEKHGEPFLYGHLPDLEFDNGETPAWDLIRVAFDTEVDARTRWLARLWPVMQELERRGFTWGFVNDEMLATVVAQDGELRVGDHLVGAVVLFDAPAMEAGSAVALADAAEAGGAVLGVGPLPARQPGFAGHERGDAAVAGAMRALRSAPRFATSGGTSILSGARRIGLRPRVELREETGGVRLARRQLASGGQLVLLRNPTAEPHSATVGLPAPCATPYYLDAFHGEASPVIDPDRIRVRVAGYSSCFLVCGDGPPPSLRSAPRPGACAVAPAPVRAHPLTGWSVEGVDASGAPVRVRLPALRDLRDVPELRDAGGVVRYSTVLTVEDLPERGFGLELDLGWVQGVAEARVNGAEVGRAVVAPFVLDVSGVLVEGDNRIDIDVEVPTRNALLARGASGDPVYDQFRGRSDTRVASGLLGPARIVQRPAGR